MQDYFCVFVAWKFRQIQDRYCFVDKKGDITDTTVWAIMDNWLPFILHWRGRRRRRGRGRKESIKVGTSSVYFSNTRTQKIDVLYKWRWVDKGETWLSTMLLATVQVYLWWINASSLHVNYCNNYCCANYCKYHIFLVYIIIAT